MCAVVLASSCGGTDSVRCAVVLAGSCGGTDSGTSASPPSYPVFPLSQNVVNEYCMKSLRPASCWKWTFPSVLRATILLVL